jgi:membrane protease YdiL (CAAX protease family)
MWTDARLQALRAQLSPVPATIFVAGGLCLWLYGDFSSLHFFSEAIVPRLGLSAVEAGATAFFYWYGSTVVTLVVLPTLALRIAERRVRPEDRVPLGWGLGDRRFGLAAAALAYAVMLVLVAFAVSRPEFRAKYPLYQGAGRSLGAFLAYEAAYVLYFVGWESFFRGFLTLGLARTLGVWSAFVQMLPFVVLHLGKPHLEVMSSVFGGVLLGVLALRTGSFWYGFLIHAATAVTLDVLVVAMR